MPLRQDNCCKQIHTCCGEISLRFVTGDISRRYINMDHIIPANRVSQVESRNLDNELNQTLDTFIDELDISSYGEELKLALKIYLSINHIKDHATTGMKVHKLKFIDCNRMNESGISEDPKRYKLILLATCNLVSSYITRRFRRFELMMERSYLSRLHISWLTLDNIMLGLKAMNLLNFFLFLRTGKYVNFIERLLGLTHITTIDGHYATITLNKVQTDFMYREAVWKVLADFLSTIIPMINFERVKNQAYRMIGLMPSFSSQITLSDKVQRESNASRCVICNKQPFNPYVIGCRHVFCYYCMHARHLSDTTQGFSCMLCNYSTQDKTMVQRYRKLEVLQ